MAKYAALVSTCVRGGRDDRPPDDRDAHRALRSPVAGRVSIGFKTSPQNVDWPTIDATWARAGELGVFDSGWLNDHITDPAVEHGGPSWESLTLLGALAGRVPGLTVGHGVLSNTFRNPVLVAKAATLLDHVTGGRFVLGLGAGWHEGEHVPFGIPLPPIASASTGSNPAVGTIKALFSAAATSEPASSGPDPFYPLDCATNLPAPLTPGGPPMWLGGQKKRGLALVAREGAGWMLPAIPRFDYDYFADKRERILTELGVNRAATRMASPSPPSCRPARAAEERRAAVDAGVRFSEIGATYLILGMPAGPRATWHRDGRRGGGGAAPRPARMTIEVRPATIADHATFADVVNEVTPEYPTSVEELAWQDATYPGGVRFIASLDGTVAGCGHVGRIYMYQPDFDAYWADIAVRPEARRRGVAPRSTPRCPTRRATPASPTSTSPPRRLGRTRSRSWPTAGSSNTTAGRSSSST
jgi:alkanesulfonate monooxygenase SsuD/methylene tetrahydromethanopterin reductase-like flavin-dependent oxidoreductase (luciferase family)